MQHLVLLVDAVFDAFNLDHYTFNYWHDAKNKWSSLPKEVQEWRDEQATLYHERL